MAANISWKLTLFSLILMLFMALLTSYYGTLLHKRFHKAQEAFSSLNDKVQESISRIKVVRTFGEEAILQSLKKKRRKKTTIITSHRLSAIQYADLILVLDQGEIIQSGTHNQLIEAEGWYQDMYVRQQLENQVELGG